ncbi:MAG: helix-turn-helix domain-containing protein [Sarcina sp.]
MKINEIIKEKRLLKGLTQEEVANYLRVSTPAVNKWEKGVSYPDITLLPSLARLLGVDLNTLLSFKEDLTDEEIGHFMNELVAVMSKDGFDVGFNLALEKISEYPTCGKLALSTGASLQGGLYLFNVENKEKYEEKIEKLYIEAKESKDIEVRNSAISMLINKYLEKEECEKAEKLIEELLSITYDKKELQTRLYKKKGDKEKALETMEERLLKNVTDNFMILNEMMIEALSDKRIEDAENYATLIEETTKKYDLWEYNIHAAYFQLYTAKKDEENSIKTLRNMLETIQKPWNYSNSNLYKHMKKKENDESFSEIFLPNFIRMLKEDKEKELEFLKENKEFQKLINEL